MSEKSELKVLLKRNASGELTVDEYKKARSLILRDPEYSKDDCRFCDIYYDTNLNKSIFDTGLCVSCALYALNTNRYCTETP